MDVGLLFQIYLAMATVGWGIFGISAILGLDHHLHALHLGFGGVEHHFESFLEHHGIDVGTEGDVNLAANPLNFRNALAFAGACGTAGALAIANGAAVWLGVTVSALSGLLVTAMVWMFTVYIYSLRFSGHTKESDYLLADGVVTISIPRDGMGEIAAVINGQHKNLPARSVTGEAIVKGEEVTTSDYQDGIVLVVKGKGQLFPLDPGYKRLTGKE